MWKKYIVLHTQNLLSLAKKKHSKMSKNEKQLPPLRYVNIALSLLS